MDLSGFETVSSVEPVEVKKSRTKVIKKGAVKTTAPKKEVKKAISSPIRIEFVENSHTYKKVFQTCEKENIDRVFILQIIKRILTCSCCGHSYQFAN